MSTHDLSRTVRQTFCGPLHGILVFILSLNLTLPASAQEYVLNLPDPSDVKPMSRAFQPAVLRAVTIDPKDPFLFDFLVDKGDSGLEGEALEAETQKLVKYFLAALTVPENELWVNLSPYEQDAMIPQVLGVTELGKDLLIADYYLKQVTAGMTNPNSPTGKKFWDTAYAEAQKQFGTTQVPINTFSKVWIVPADATVLEKDGTAFVADSQLKVFLEQDYLAIKQNLNNKEIGTDKINDQKAQDINALSANLIREIVLPQIEKEVNAGENFGVIRQIYSSAVLAAWYKKRLKETILGKLYADQNKVAGVNAEDLEVGDKIFDKYTAALKDGVYSMIKQDYDLASQKILQRKYFSGGANFTKLSSSTAIRPISDPVARASLSPRASSVLNSAVQGIRASAGTTGVSREPVRYASARVRVASAASTTVQRVGNQVASRNATGGNFLLATLAKASNDPGTRSDLLLADFFANNTLEQIAATLADSPNPVLNTDASNVAQALQTIARENPNLLRTPNVSRGDTTMTDFLAALSRTLPADTATAVTTALSASNERKRIAGIQLDRFNRQQDAENALAYVDASTLGAALARVEVERPQDVANRFVALRTSNPIASRSLLDLAAVDAGLTQVLSRAVEDPRFQEDLRQSQPVTSPSVRALLFAPEDEIRQTIRTPANRPMADAGKIATEIARQIVEIRESQPSSFRDLNVLRAQNPDLVNTIEELNVNNVFQPLEQKYLVPVAPNQAEVKFLAQRLHEAIPPQSRGSGRNAVTQVKLEEELSRALRTDALADGKKFTATNYPALKSVMEIPAVQSAIRSLPGFESRSRISTVDYIRNVFQSDIPETNLRESVRTALPSRFSAQDKLNIASDIVAIRRQARTAPDFGARLSSAANMSELRSVINGTPGLTVSNSFANLDDSAVKQLGGIDLSDERMALKIKVDGNGVPLPVSDQDIENLKIDGLVPMILGIEPATPQTVPYLMNLSSAATNN